MLGAGPNELWIDEAEASEEDLLKRVLEALSAREQSVEEISDQIPGSVPWDVLRCCRKLCRLGMAVEGRGAATGQFSAALNK